MMVSWTTFVKCRADLRESVIVKIPKQECILTSILLITGECRIAGELDASQFARTEMSFVTL